MSFPNQSAASAYNRIGVQTRVAQPSQYDLVVMMFDVILESLTRAQGAIHERNINDKVKLIGKVVRIIEEGLRTSLDTENGGELAENLNALYDYCVIRLTLANANNDAALVGEVIDLLRPIAEAWRDIDPGRPGRGSAGSEGPGKSKPTMTPSSASFTAFTRGFSGLGGTRLAV